MIESNVGMFQFINTMRSGNPEQTMMTVLQTTAKGNPVFENLLSLAQKGNTKEIETIARNMTKERGLDFDTEFNSFKRTFGL